MRALERRMAQIVVAAAGYDGRALRYAKPGVRWFEVDHPDTQSDKCSRLGRLQIDTTHIQFVPADFTVDDVAAGLESAGHDRHAASLILVEGVAVYLSRDVLETLLAQLRVGRGAAQPHGDQPVGVDGRAAPGGPARRLRCGRRVGRRTGEDSADRGRRHGTVRVDRLAHDRDRFRQGASSRTRPRRADRLISR